MERGTVCGLVIDRGFGFIDRGGNEPHVFFHMRDLVDLEFDLTRTEGGQVRAGGQSQRAASGERPGGEVIASSGVVSRER